MQLPKEFITRMEQLGQDANKIYATVPRKCIRTKDEQTQEPVPWYPKATYNFSAVGYIQDSASLLPAIILDPKPGEIILDMCAAPGSKTTQMCEMVTVSIIAVDVNKNRLMRLKKNAKNLGCEGIRIIRADARKLKLDVAPDRILLDAPCSGEGIVMKSHKTFKIW